MLSTLSVPVLALALSAGATLFQPCDPPPSPTFPPPGCTVMYENGVCYLQCDECPFIRPCDPE